MTTPPNVLCLVDPRNPSCHPCALARWSALWHRLNPSSAPAALVLGGRDDAQLVRNTGFTVSDAMHRAPSPFLFCAKRFARAINRWACRRPAPIIHALSWEACALARRAAPHIPILISAESAVPSVLIARLVARATLGRPTIVLLENQLLRQSLVHAGLGSLPSVIMPGWFTDESLLAPRQAVRHPWVRDGLIHDNSLVIGILAEPRSCDAWVAANIVLRCMLAGMDVRLIMHPLARRLAHARGLSREFNFGNLFILDDRIAQPWRILRGIDVALMPSLISTSRAHRLDAFPPLFRAASSSEPLGVKAALAWCAAANTPVILDHLPWLTTTLISGSNMAVLAPGDWNHACQLIMSRFHLHENPPNGWQKTSPMSKQSLTSGSDLALLSRVCAKLVGITEIAAS